MPQNFFREVRTMRDFARKHGFKNLKDFPYAHAYGYRYSKKDPRILSANWYNLPDVNLVIDQLTKDWETDNLPLTIELENGKVKITHTPLSSPHHHTLPADLTLFPEISYLLGFSESIQGGGRVINFNDSLVQYAPHLPHCFADLTEEKLNHLLKKLDLEAPANIVIKMHDTMNKMIEMVEEKLKEKDEQCAEAKKRLIKEKDESCKTSKKKLKLDHHHEINELYVQSEDTINNLRRFYEREIDNLTKEDESNLNEQSKKLKCDLELTSDKVQREMQAMIKKSELELSTEMDDNLQAPSFDDEIQKPSLDIDLSNPSLELKENLSSKEEEMEKLVNDQNSDEGELSKDTPNQKDPKMNFQEQMIVDCEKTQDNQITLISKFDEKVNSSLKWSLKGAVKASGMKDIGNDESLFVVTLQDCSGTIDIAGFGDNATVMQNLLELGKQYYVEMIDWNEKEKDIFLNEDVKLEEVSPSNLRVSIKNNVFKVKIVEA